MIAPEKVEEEIFGWGAMSPADIAAGQAEYEKLCAKVEGLCDPKSDEAVKAFYREHEKLQGQFAEKKKKRRRLLPIRDRR